MRTVRLILGPALLFGAAHAFSQAGPAPTAPTGAAMTAAQAAAAKDDAYVVLEGTVVRRIRGEKYEFRDASGVVTVEIDDEKWPNRQPVLNKRVRLDGEVDQKRVRRTVEIEVDRVELVN